MQAVQHYFSKKHQRNCNQLSTELSSLDKQFVCIYCSLSPISVYHLCLYHLYLQHLTPIFIYFYLSSIYLTSILIYHLSTVYHLSLYLLSIQLSTIDPSSHPSISLPMYLHIFLSQSSLLFLKAFLISLQQMVSCRATLKQEYPQQN